MRVVLVLGLLAGCNHASPLAGAVPSDEPLCITQLQTADALTCALKRDGTVWCWGLFYYGDSDDKSVNMPTPTRMDGMPPAVQVANAGSHACARTSDGDVWCWGWNFHGELTQPGTVGGSVTPLLGFRHADTVFAGAYVTCVIRGGAVECSGITPTAPNGGGVDGPWTNTPVAAPELSPATELALGTAWSCALGPDRAVRCWGDNWGTLGDGSTDSHASPVEVTSLDHDVAQLSAGEEHNCALRSDGTVWCWGITGGGNGTYTPTRVADVSGAIAVAAGASSSCAVLEGGKVVCWLKDAPLAAPVQTVALPRPAVSVTSTYQRACALTDDGSAWCWSDAGGTEPGTIDAPARIALDCNVH